MLAFGIITSSWEAEVTDKSQSHTHIISYPLGTGTIDIQYTGFLKKWP